MKISTVTRLVLMSGMLLSAAYLVSCGSKAPDTVMSEQQQSTDYYTATEEVKEAAMDALEAASQSGGGQKDRAGDPGSYNTPADSREQIQAKVIKTADISYQVEDFDESRRKILETVSRFRARVSSENQTNDGYRLSNTMVIRVEGGGFDSLVDALMTEAIYVEYKTVNAQDVTEEYVDLTARLKSKKELEARYSEILKKANTINEILEVQEYLGRIREEIESFEGRLKYMDDRVAFSTISLKYYEQLDNVSKQPDRTFGSRMEEAFGTGWNGLVTFFLGLIYLWPLWLIMGLLTWLVVFLVKRARRRRRTSKESKQNPS